MTDIIETDRLIIKNSDISLAEALLKYYSDNRIFFEKYEPVFQDSFYTYEYQKKVMEFEMNNMEKHISAYYYFSLKEKPEDIIGTISFVRIRKEPYASTIFGYNQDEKHQGHGYCSEACAASIRDVLGKNHIHRIESRALTTNQKSINILKRLGFEEEGIERKGILIDGSFRDHYRFAYINENY